MDGLKKRLTKELEQNLNVKIMKSLSWGLPVHSIEIVFETVKRTKMDILMKMILICFQKGQIAKLEEISDLLRVEVLFVRDVIDKMIHANMIENKADFYELTNIGVQQLEIGLFEHEPEERTEEMLYSPYHQVFLKGKQQDIGTEDLKDYRYKDVFDAWKIESLKDDVLIDALKETGIESDAGNAQITVSKIIATTDIEIDRIYCLEFHLYNKKEDILYARVWNTLTSEWDAVLEEQLNEKERKRWREQYV